MPKQRSAPLARVVEHLDTFLNHAGINDYSNAFNGLQVENRGKLHKIGAAVDGCEATLAEAARRGIDFLLVHHGLLWQGGQRIAGPVYRKVKLAIEADLAVYSSHLPLDLHSRVGNNALLFRALGFKKPAPFFMEKGSYLGVKTRVELDREVLRKRIEAAVGGPVKLIPGGPVKTGTVGIVSGGAGGEIFKAVEEGVDTYITGEGPHWAYPAAEELGLNVYLAGHYATETFGVKALAAHLSKRYELPWEFIDHPTGL